MYKSNFQHQFDFKAKILNALLGVHYGEPNKISKIDLNYANSEHSSLGE